MDISHNAFSVGKALLERADKEGKCFPSYKRIALDSKLSVSSVKRGLSELEKAGVIKRKNRYLVLGGQTSNIYYFT